MAIVLAAILLITAAAFFIIRSKQLDEKYQRLQHAMLNVTFDYKEGLLSINNDNTIEKIGEKLAAFPNNYRNIDDIKNQHIQIKKIWI